MDVYNCLANQLQHVGVLGVATSCAIGSFCYYLRKRNKASRESVESTICCKPSEDLVNTSATICIAVQSFLSDEKKMTWNHVLVAGLSIVSATAFSLWTKKSACHSKRSDVLILQAQQQIRDSVALENKLFKTHRVLESDECRLLHAAPPRIDPVDNKDRFSKVNSTRNAVQLPDALPTVQAENVVAATEVGGCHRAVSYTRVNATAELIKHVAIVSSTVKNKSWVSKQWKKFKGACKKTCRKIKKGLKKKEKTKVKLSKL